MDQISRAVVDNYFVLRKSIGSLVGVGKKLSGFSGGKLKGVGQPVVGEDFDPHIARRVMKYLQSAKIFSLPEEVFLRVWDTADSTAVSSCYAVSGKPVPDVLSVLNKRDSLDYRIFNLYSKRDQGSAEAWELLSSIGSPEELAKDHVSYLQSVGQHSSFPEKLPFENMYLGYGEGIPLTSPQLLIRYGFDLYSESFADIRLAGHLVCENKDIYEFITYVKVEKLKSPVSGHTGVIPVPLDWLLDQGVKIGTGEMGRRFEDLGGLREDIIPSVLPQLRKEFLRANERLLGTDDEFSVRVCDTFSWNGHYGQDALRAIAQYSVMGNLDTLPPLPESVEYEVVKLLKGACYYSVHIGEPFSDWDEVAKNKFHNIQQQYGRKGCWEYPCTMAFFVIPAIVDVINEYNKSFVQKSDYPKSFRRKISKDHKRSLPRKKGRSILPAYYVIDVMPKSLKRSISRATRNVVKLGHKLSYRHDRDAHERVLVRRGELPLSVEEERTLTLRGYTLYTEGQPNTNDQDRLVRRRLPLRQHGEWLALKTSWVRSTVVGDESLPYKPAVRRLSGVGIEGMLRDKQGF